MAIEIQLRGDTAANWTAINPILAHREPAVEFGNPNKLKIGDGISTWTALPYLVTSGGGGSTQIQSDWNQSVNASLDYIKNKPTLLSLIMATLGTMYQGDLIAFDALGNPQKIPRGTYGQVLTSRDGVGGGTADIIWDDPTHSDWNESNPTVFGYIKNKPTIPNGQVQADWAQTNSAEVDFISNKPTIPDAQRQTDWEITNTTDARFIKNKPTIPTVSGSNTGDETTATIKSKLGITTLSGSNTGDQTATSLGLGGGLSFTMTYITDDRYTTIDGAYLHQHKTQSVTYTNGIPTARGTESDWTTITGWATAAC